MSAFASPTAWIDVAPSQWKVAPLGTHFDERSETVSDVEFQPLSVTRNGVVPQLEHVAKTDNNANRKLVRTGDFAINSRSDRRGSAGLSELDGSVSVVYTVLMPRPSIDGRFAHHLLRSTAFQEEFYRWGSGIVEDLWSTRYSAMKRIPLALPPLDEQRTIADYLDQETAQIDELVAKQEEFIGLLRERRRAAIEAAVSDVVPSGAKLKHVVRSIRQGWSPQCYAWPTDGIRQWAVLKAGAVNGGLFRSKENKELPATETPRPTTVVREGDLVVSRANTRDLVGSAAVVDCEYPKLMLSDKLYAFDLDRDKALPRFVAAVLGSQRWRDLIEIEATGTSSSMLNISQDDIVNLPLALPTVGYQQAALNELDQETSRIDTLIAKSEEHIALAKERRAALITAAVTGQFDVGTARKAG